MREWEVSVGSINGELNLVFKQQGEVKAVLCLTLAKSGEQIQELYMVIAAGKLSHVTA
ncbi:hypothetical protein D3C75_1328460 [compost metagenome]